MIAKCAATDWRLVGDHNKTRLLEVAPRSQALLDTGFTDTKDCIYPHIFFFNLENAFILTRVHVGQV